MSKDGKIFFIYARISKVGEYDMSLEDQKNILLGLAQENGHTTVVIEEKESGQKKDREEFDFMMKTLLEDAKKKKEHRKYGGIYVFKLDRFARNSQDFTKGEKLLEHGYRIISATETIENTPTGKLLFRMLSSFAIFESEKLSNRQSLSRIQNLIRGRIESLGGRLIFGYMKDKNNKIIINPLHQAIIIEIFDLFLDLLENYKDYSLLLKENTGDATEDRTKINQIKKEIYLKIWEKLSDKDKLVIKQHKLKGIKDIAINDNDIQDFNFIRNILENGSNRDSKLKYNGKFTNEISINDELIINYIKNIPESDKEDIDLDGLNEIGGTMTFSFYFPELQIIDDYKFQLIKLSKQKYNKNEKDETGNYSDIIYCIGENGGKILLESYSKEGTIQYRPKKRGKNDEKGFGASQKKINEALLGDKTFKKIKFTPEMVSFLQQKTLEKTQKDLKKSLKYLEPKKVTYGRMLDSYKYKLLNIEGASNELIQRYNKEMGYYNDLVSKVNTEIANQNTTFNEDIELFLTIFSDTQNILNNTPQIVNKKIKVLFDEIIIDKNQKGKIIIKDVKISLFIKEILGL